MSYIKFQKIEDLVWSTIVSLRHNSSMVDKRFLESKYPNAHVYLQRVSSDGYYLIRIKFKTEADEAEFILRESNEN
jgi:predicted RNA-binding protein